LTRTRTEIEFIELLRTFRVDAHTPYRRITVDRVLILRSSVIENEHSK
jgi:hypothetical protein